MRTTEELIPPYYETQCFSRDDFGEAGKPAKIPWDFIRYQPEVVRKNKPQAYIFCVLGLMGDRLYDKLCEAVADYIAETGDECLMTVHIPEQNPVNGYDVAWQPVPKSHTMAAEIVAAAIREKMGW